MVVHPIRNLDMAMIKKKMVSMIKRKMVPMMTIHQFRAAGHGWQKVLGAGDESGKEILLFVQQSGMIFVKLQKY